MEIKNFSGTQSKNGLFRDFGNSDVKRYEEEYVEINYLSQTEFSFKGAHVYYRETYDSGNDECKAHVTGSGIYEIVNQNPEEKYYELKLKFNLFKKEKENEYGNNKETIEKDDVVLTVHYIGDDLYFDRNDYFNFLFVWGQYLNMLVRCGVSKGESVKMLHDYYQLIQPKSFKPDKSLSYFEVDQTFPIFEKFFPTAKCMNNIFMILYEYLYEYNYSAEDLCVMWKNANFKLTTFANQNNIEEFLSGFQEDFEKHTNSEILKQFI